MKSLPLPLRLAAGLAATAVERARELPTQIAGLPVTVVSQALQATMRVQQHVTELAIKGDEALAALRPVEEAPEWATFDEDVDSYDLSRPAFDRVTDDDIDDLDDIDDEPVAEQAEVEVPDDPAAADPWEQEEQAITAAVTPPASIPNYDELSLPQLRARLRAFSVADLEEALAYERASENRASFVGMLTRRIATVRDQT
ncbi:lipid droplet-associated protein [Actinokineospora sp.]|uniref:lipid droplet-associated protein n=1 Tax=Actinokineospora sp. TaxID=1872133 RepID=UPI003D6BA4B9